MSSCFGGPPRRKSRRRRCASLRALCCQWRGSMGIAHSCCHQHSRPCFDAVRLNQIGVRDGELAGVETGSGQGGDTRCLTARQAQSSTPETSSIQQTSSTQFTFAGITAILRRNLRLRVQTGQNWGGRLVVIGKPPEI